MKQYGLEKSDYGHMAIVAAHLGGGQSLSPSTATR